MKFEEFKKQYIERTCLSAWCNSYQWNEDGSVDANSYVLTTPAPEIKMTKLPFKFNIIMRDFDCSHRGLETLDNFPNIVEGDVFCYGNPGKFTEEDIRSICQVKGRVITNQE